MFAVLLLLLRQTESTLSNSLQGQTVLLPPSNYLFIRFAGDEAAAVLAAVQFASAVGSKLTRYLRVFYGSSTGPLSVARQVLRFSLTIIVIGFFTVVAWDRYSADASVRAAIAGLLPEKVIWLCVVMSGIFFVSATLGLAIFAFQAASAWAYGWTRFMEGFLVEFAIEPLPFGNYRLCSIDWNEEFPNLKSLYHSWSYAHPIAVGHIVDWVDRTLRDISAQNSEREM